MWTVALPAILALSFSSTTDSVWVVDSGARLRLWVDGHPTTGEFDRVEDGWIHLRGSDDRAWNLEAVDRIEVSTERKGHALVGGFVGLFVGYGVARLAVEAVEDEGPPGQASSDLSTIQRDVLVGVGAWAGTVLAGALIGHFIKSDRWETVQRVPRVPSQPEETSLGLRLRF